jgi:hypothetical protein
MAAWRWYNYVSSQVPPAKEVLRLNLDETSVCLYQGDVRGNVFVSKKQRATQYVPRSKRRCCMTHIGVVCDSTEIQPRLPQVVIGNEATFKAREMPALRASCPANVILLRQRSAWSNNVVCAWLVRRIGVALEPYSARCQPVLLLDASRTHITPLVLAACHAAGIWVVLVPAKLTWLLQPLDTHGFNRYKAHLRRKYQEARIVSPDLEIGEFLACLYSAVRQVLQGIHWAIAFDQDGFGARQHAVSSKVVDQLGAPPGGQALSSRPTVAEVALCFPRRAAVPTVHVRALVAAEAAWLWRPFDVAPPVHAPPAAVAPLDRLHPFALSVAPARREPRTRAEHAAAAAAMADARASASSSSGLPAMRLAGVRSAASSSSGVPAAAAAVAAPVAPRVFGRTRSATRLLSLERGGGGDGPRG